MTDETYSLTGSPPPPAPCPVCAGEAGEKRWQAPALVFHFEHGCSQCGIWLTPRQWASLPRRTTVTPEQRLNLEISRASSDAAYGVMPTAAARDMRNATDAAGHALNVARAWEADSAALRSLLADARRALDDATDRNATLQGELVEKQKALEQVRIANTAVQSSYQQERTESARLRSLVEVLRLEKMGPKHLALERAAKRLLHRTWNARVTFRLKKNAASYEHARAALDKLVNPK